MPRIQCLEPLVINQIAAGEVIERPASVVKELLENSLDALATRVEIDVGDGGAELLRIVDDGEGIHPDDLVLAVSSHATSKIRSADDLFQIHTMGFRGEALASIASVSRMRIRSRQPGSDTGHEIEVLAGAVGPIRPCGCPEGTSIEVRQLFLNTPVRRKFLKSAPTEFGHISEIFTRIALANPRLHGVLRHNDRVVYELPPTSQLLDRLRLFFGGDTADKLIPIEAKAGDVRLWGYVGHPDQTKATRKGQYLFLNGRWIQDRSLQHALTEAYRGLVMVGRQPISFLFLEAPSDSVDVNVHPTKAEVRFRDPQVFYRLLLSTLRTKFLSMDLGGTMRLPGAGGEGGGPTMRPGNTAGRGGLVLTPSQPLSQPSSQPLSRPASTLGFGPPPSSGFGPRSASYAGGSGVALAEAGDFGTDEAAAWSDGPAVGLAERPAASPQRQSELEQELAAWANDQLASWNPDAEPVLGHIAPPTDDPFSADANESYANVADLGGMADGVESRGASWEIEPDSLGVQDSPVDSEGRNAASTLSPAESHVAAVPQSSSVASQVASPVSPHVSPHGRVMQVHDCYLILETPDGVQLIDQHALHERILYEQLRRRVLAGAVESQRLLVPLTLELTGPETVALLESRDVLRQLGYGIDEFGGTTLLLTAYPTMLRKADHARLLRDLAEEMVEASRKPTRRDLLDHLLHSMACRAAIKSGQRLTPEEMDALLAQRGLVEDSHHCPHGRPTSLDLSREELDRQFGRLGADR